MIVPLPAGPALLRWSETLASRNRDQAWFIAEGDRPWYIGPRCSSSLVHSSCPYPIIWYNSAHKICIIEAGDSVEKKVGDPVGLEVGDFIVTRVGALVSTEVGESVSRGFCDSVGSGVEVSVGTEVVDPVGTEIGDSGD